MTTPQRRILPGLIGIGRGHHLPPGIDGVVCTDYATAEVLVPGTVPEVRVMTLR